MFVGHYEFICYSEVNEQNERQRCLRGSLTQEFGCVNRAQDYPNPARRVNDYAVSSVVPSLNGQQGLRRGQQPRSS